MPLDTLLKKGQVFAHMLDQHAVIHGVGRAMPALYAVGSLALLGSDLYAAKTPQERKKVAIRDTIVLGFTVVGTLIGAAIMKHSHHHASTPGMTPILKELAERYDAKVIQTLQKGADKLNYSELKSVVSGMWANAKARLEGVKDSKNRGSILNGFWEDLRQKALPVEEENETLTEKLVHVGRTFLGGLVAVAGGVVGGLFANKAVGGSKENQANIFKEAVFQFVANIALCAVGAFLGMVVIDQLKIKNTLVKSALLFSGMGLGIFGGGRAANWFGPKTVNPLLDWWGQPKHTWADLKHRLHHAWNNGGDARKVEFADMILHLDDIPTIFYFAGMKIFGPLIQLFFAFSGYRAGIGYRNEPALPGLHSASSHSKHTSQPQAVAPSASATALFPTLSSFPKTSANTMNPLMSGNLPVHNRFVMA